MTQRVVINLFRKEVFEARRANFNGEIIRGSHWPAIFVASGTIFFFLAVSSAIFYRPAHVAEVVITPAEDSENGWLISPISSDTLSTLSNDTRFIYSRPGFPPQEIHVEFDAQPSRSGGRVGKLAFSDRHKVEICNHLKSCRSQLVWKEETLAQTILRNKGL